MSQARQQLGKRGEALAESFLVGRGYELLERRFRCRSGEIDLILDQRGTLVFVEVKARAGLGYGAPAAAVTPRKRRLICRAALWFLARKGWLERPCRFDVIEVLDRQGETEIHHIPDAFRD